MVYAWKEMEEMKWGRSMAPAALWLVSARMQQGSSIAVMVGECGDGAGKEHCHGCWRSGGGVAVDGECCGDGAGKEQTNESTNMFPHLFAPACPENT